jgi:hypothetical protein
MKTTLDVKIRNMKDIFEGRGFIIEDSDNGFSFRLDSLGMPEAVIDFYALKTKQGQYRARVKKKFSSPEETEEEIGDISLRIPTDLEFIRNHLEEELLGTAKIEKFHYFGCRDNAYLYYACVLMDNADSDHFLRKSRADRALAQLKGIDSKLFRQGLDSLGLPRSSIVRLSLTRIFRNAMDAEGLLEAASSEADRIINADEWKRVRGFVKQSHVPFMRAVFYLLWEEISRSYMRRAWETLHK